MGAPQENAPDPEQALDLDNDWEPISYEELEDWMKDNEHLLRWYRPHLPSFRLCLWSAFRIHVETVNIWSHLIGSVIFFCLWMRHLSWEKTTAEKVSFSAFFISAILCCFFSSLYHLVSCHSPQIARSSRVLDYTGIGVLVVGSFVPWLYYSFFCKARVALFYQISVGILGIISVTVCLHPRFIGADYRWLRSATFVVLGLSGVIPTIHNFMTEGVLRSLDELCVGYLTLMATAYIAGALFYATRVPERFAPGKFDVWFHSHQIFHFAVLAGAAIEYIGITRLAGYRNFCEQIGTCHCGS